MMTRSFEQALCPMKTTLPEGSQDIEPEDAKTLRWAVRASADGAGFLFLNNYQDHAETLPKAGEDVTIKLPSGDVVFEGLSLAAGENCALPFNLDVGGVTLWLAHAQPLKVIETPDDSYAFFFTPEGMQPLYAFPEGTLLAPETDGVRVDGLVARIVEGFTETSDLREDCPVALIEDGFAHNGFDMNTSGGVPCFAATQDSRTVHFVTLSRAQSLNFSVLNYKGREVAAQTEGVLLPSENSLKIEHDQPVVGLSLFPDGAIFLSSQVLSFIISYTVTVSA
jgi:hypothetical protein